MSSIYPSAIDTNTTLLSTADNFTTTLVGDISSSATTFQLASVSKVTAGTVLTVGSELIKVVSVASTTCTVTRGFDSTSAVAHSNNSKVYVYINAVHQRVLKESVIAIETLLGVNGVNFSQPFVNVKKYGAVGDGTTDDTTSITNAINAASAAGGGIVYFPPGTYLVTNTLPLPGSVYLFGNGSQLGTHVNSPTVTNTKPASQIYLGVNNKPLFNITGSKWAIKSLALYMSSGTTPTSSSVGIKTYYAGATGDLFSFTIEDVWVGGFYYGIFIDGSTDSILNNVQSSGNLSHGIVGKGAQGYWTNIQCINNGNNSVTGHGLYLTSYTTAGGVQPFLRNYQSYSNSGWGLYIDQGQLDLNGFYLNNDALGELYIKGVTLGGSAMADAGIVTHGWIQFSGVSVWSGANLANAPGLFIDSASGPVNISKVEFFGCNGNSVEINNGAGNVLTSCQILGSGVSGNAGHTYAILASAGGNLLNNLSINAPIKLSGNSNSFTNSTIQIVNNTYPTILINSGDRVVVDNNLIYNGGAANAFTTASGTTLLRGHNTIIGNQSLGGKLSDYSQQNVSNLGSTLTISSNVITITDSIHYLGAGLVKTMLFPHGPGNYVIIPSAAFTTDTSSNITTIFTAQINVPVKVTYDGTSVYLGDTYVNTHYYIGTENGANNAIAGILTNIYGAPITIADGVRVTVKLAHTLQAGANTITINGTPYNIKSSRNSANNIATAYASTGTISLVASGSLFLDISQ